MPVLRKVPQKLYTKEIVKKGCGYITPQDGSVCKIKVTLDEADLITGLDEDKTKEIIVGDVDEPIDLIIEDCIRTMKEEEECCIQFQHPDDNTNVIPLDMSDDVKDARIGTPVDTSEDTKSAKVDASSPENSAGDFDNKQQSVSDMEVNSENAKEAEQPDSISNTNSTSDVLMSNVEEVGEPSQCNKEPPHLVKVQFQLLSYTREPEIWEMSITEKWRRASYHKQKGLELYARGMYQYAFRRFGLTLKYVISLEHDVPSGQEEGMDIKGLKLSCYLNLAACQMRHHNFESVVKNSSKAIDLQPDNAKALYRRGAAYVQLQEYEKGEEDLLAAQQLEPKNQAIAKQLQILKSRVQKLNQYYANAMKKMFS